MTIHIELIPLLSIVAGIAALMVPKFLRYIVGIYLIAIGVMDMLGY